MIWTARVRFAGLNEDVWVGFDDESSIPQSLHHSLLALCKRRNRQFVLGWWVLDVPDHP